MEIQILPLPTCKQNDICALTSPIECTNLWKRRTMFFQVAVMIKQLPFLPLEVMKVSQINSMEEREATPKVSFPWSEQGQATEISRKKEI